MSTKNVYGEASKIYFSQLNKFWIKVYCERCKKLPKQASGCFTNCLIPLTIPEAVARIDFIMISSICCISNSVSWPVERKCRSRADNVHLCPTSSASGSSFLEDKIHIFTRIVQLIEKIDNTFSRNLMDGKEEIKLWTIIDMSFSDNFFKLHNLVNQSI